MRYYWQRELRLSDSLALRQPVTARLAVLHARDLGVVRLVSEADLVYQFAAKESQCAEPLIRSRRRFKTLVMARALAALVFELLGWSIAETAEAMGLAKSSVHELMRTYRHRRAVRESVDRAGEAFGKNGVTVFGGGI